MEGRESLLSQIAKKSPPVVAAALTTLGAIGCSDVDSTNPNTKNPTNTGHERLGAVPSDGARLVPYEAKTVSTPPATVSTPITSAEIAETEPANSAPISVETIQSDESKDLTFERAKQGLDKMATYFKLPPEEVEKYKNTGSTEGIKSFEVLNGGFILIKGGEFGVEDTPQNLENYRLAVNMLNAVDKDWAEWAWKSGLWVVAADSPPGKGAIFKLCSQTIGGRGCITTYSTDGNSLFVNEGQFSQPSAYELMVSLITEPEGMNQDRLGGNIYDRWIKKTQYGLEWINKHAQKFLENELQALFPYENLGAYPRVMKKDLERILIEYRKLKVEKEAAQSNSIDNTLNQKG